MNDNSKTNEEKANENKRKPIQDYEEFFNQTWLRSIPSNNPIANFKNLSTPRFLGSYHIRQSTDPKFNAFSKVMKGNLELKYAKALRNAFLNPVTIALIIVAIVFNILWFFLL